MQFLRLAGVAVRGGSPAADAPLLCLSGRLKEGVHSDHGVSLSSLNYHWLNFPDASGSELQSCKETSTMMGQGHNSLLSPLVI